MARTASPTVQSVCSFIKKQRRTYWSYLENASIRTVDSIVSALEQAGETEFPKVLRHIKDNFSDDPAKLRTFVSGNVKFLRAHIMAYVKKNIEQFY